MLTGDEERWLRDALAERGFAPDRVGLVDPSDEQRPLPPPGQWLIARYGSTYVVGAIGRGKFRAYEQLFTLADAADLAMTLLRPSRQPTQSVSLGEALRWGAATAADIAQRVTQRGSGQPALVNEGSALDCIGVETEHHLFALGTPFPQRSQPPSDIGLPVNRYAVHASLPPDCREGVAAPWFGQPGGGAMVVLDRPIRWYVDNGFLREIVVADPS